MGILDNFERGLERAVNGAFARTFKSGLQPIEITAALRKELDTRAAVVARDRVLAPNRFAVRLSREDFERMSAMGSTLTDELTALVQQHARSQGYQFASPVSIRLDRDETLAAGMVQVDSASTRGDVSWTPVIEVDGKRYPLKRGRVVIGRGSDADITIADSGTSRRHVEIIWDGSQAQANDLGSTNGTTLNGERIDRALLPPDSVVQIGRTRIVFRVVPRSADGQHEVPEVRGGR